MDKVSVRQAILNHRSRYSNLEREKASKQIQNHLLQWPVFQEAQIVHIFVNQAQEVETTSIIQHCWQTGKTVAVPYLVPQSAILGHSILTTFEQLQTEKFGLREPRSETRQPIDLNTIDLVIVPGLAFDRRGGRLGYGKGYYDRFLSQIKPFFLALAFQFQVLPSIPQFPYDVPMNAILTEKGFIHIT
ncbi:MAG: 5-formyltetrahydrofolate cyclo-ligase [SAR324 cluster bacterium]|nr:5-formyltetrahydrofolate cyclo-ligase [SAR324 cluster bacterium]